MLVIITILLSYTMHKNTNKQNQYLFIHFEYPSPQAHTKQLMISLISTSGPTSGPLPTESIFIHTF